MGILHMHVWRACALPVLALAIAGCGAYGPYHDGAAAYLTGDQEVPPVQTAATGSAHITVEADRRISGTVTTSDIAGTGVHIHTGASGENGPVIVPLKKTGPDSWSIPANTRLTEEQYADYRNGRLYVNVHSEDHPNGEIRTQLGPPAPAAPGRSGYYY